MIAELHGLLVMPQRFVAVSEGRVWYSRANALGMGSATVKVGAAVF